MVFVFLEKNKISLSYLHKCKNAKFTKCVKMLPFFLESWLKSLCHFKKKFQALIAFIWRLPDRKLSKTCHKRSMCWDSNQWWSHRELRPPYMGCALYPCATTVPILCQLIHFWRNILDPWRIPLLKHCCNLDEWEYVLNRPNENRLKLLSLSHLVRNFN